jgi:hypothetical protein
MPTKTKSIVTGNVLRIFLFIFTFIFLQSCRTEYDLLKSGDLLFQVNESNDFTDAITTTTGNKTRYSFSHVGIVACEGDEVFVLEAVPGDGVRKVNLDKFLESSAKGLDGKAMVVAYRVKTDKDNVYAAVQIASSYIGYPYDSVFLPNNNAFYCSELVYESFLDRSGNHLFSEHPMSFSDSTGNISPLWISYFSKMGISVPEGVAGTNPNDMSKESVLKRLW